MQRSIKLGTSVITGIARMPLKTTSDKDRNSGSWFWKAAHQGKRNLLNQLFYLCLERKEMNKGCLHKLKYKQPCPRFEAGLLISFLITNMPPPVSITITPLSCCRFEKNIYRLYSNVCFYQSNGWTIFCSSYKWLIAFQEIVNFSNTIFF